jgi:hypothetical protein
MAKGKHIQQDVLETEVTAGDVKNEIVNEEEVKDFAG